MSNVINLTVPDMFDVYELECEIEGSEHKVRGRIEMSGDFTTVLSAPRWMTFGEAKDLLESAQRTLCAKLSFEDTYIAGTLLETGFELFCHEEELKNCISYRDRF